MLSILDFIRFGSLRHNISGCGNMFPKMMFLLLIIPLITAEPLSIHIAGFFPMGLNVSEGAVGRGVLPAVKLALFNINNDIRILKGMFLQALNHYTKKENVDVRLHISWNNTQCSAADGMKAFFDMMDQAPLKYMLFGDACTQVTDPIAKASKHWKIVQLSYADMHPMFSKKNFPNLYRIVPSENEFNEPRVELLKKFNWTRVGTLYQNQPRYSLAHNKLVSDLEMIGIEVVAAQSFSDDIHYQMAKLKDKDVRIILGVSHTFFFLL
jgi:gamma-aminobutyric acid type B receptor